MPNPRPTSPTSALQQACIGAQIRLLRHQRGMTQQTLASAIGVARSTVAFWETERGDPDAGTLVRIARVLDVPLEMFLTGMMSQSKTETISADEEILLHLYRGCGVEGRLVVVRTAARMSRPDTPDKTKPAP